jgi:hypothetical protein
LKIIIGFEGFMEKTIDVLAVGNAIVDVFSTCDDDFLDQQSIGKGMMNLVDAERSAALYADLGQSEKNVRRVGSQYGGWHCRTWRCGGLCRTCA